MSRYKVLLVIFSLVCISFGKIIQGQTNEEQSQVKNAHKNCQNDANTYVEPILLEAMSKGTLSEDPQLKLHMLCLAKGLNIIDKIGHLNKDFMKQKFLSHYEGDDLKEMEKCLEEKTSPEETAWEFYKCHFSTAKKLLQKQIRVK
ncbi:unnamed protein product [Brassicogethes aeneus]|uniref:Uncharacterized protein n=1 Tax=Brassicogethes aeneus TaxID=1431903 RepID=A0A9P0B120_BRAAE|nr:unnamed protein product [Brassicogethes aeneus]